MTLEKKISQNDFPRVKCQRKQQDQVERLPNVDALLAFQLLYLKISPTIQLVTSLRLPFLVSQQTSSFGKEGHFYLQNYIKLDLFPLLNEVLLFP